MESSSISNSELLLEHNACPMCGTDKPAKHKQFIFTPFRVVQCTQCQLWYLSPRLLESEMLKAYADPNYFKGYGEYGYSEQQGNYLDQEKSLLITFKKFILQLKRRAMTGGDLLEIGSGYGFLLKAAAPYFDSLTGTDFDHQAIARIKQLGYQAIQGGANDIPSDKYYDVIISTGVIEHIYEPVPFIKKLSQHLNSQGWMIFATPQINSFWFKLQGKNWASFKIPEHVTYYDRFTLSELFRRCGATETITLPYLHAFPLGMISKKLGFSLPTWLAKYHLWLPATMFAVAARFDNINV